MKGVGGSTEAQSGVGWEGNATKRMMQGARDMRYTVGWLVGRDEKQETHGRNNTLSKHHEKKREHKHRALSRGGVGGWRRCDWYCSDAHWKQASGKWNGANLHRLKMKQLYLLGPPRLAAAAVDQLQLRLGQQVRRQLAGAAHRLGLDRPGAGLARSCCRCSGGPGCRVTGSFQLRTEVGNHLGL